jgi:hypothetical protein
MKNITLALDEKTIEAGREYARKHNLTLNSLIRKLLQQTVSNSSHDWVEESFSLMDKAKVTAHARKWKREDLYRV